MLRLKNSAGCSARAGRASSVTGKMIWDSGEWRRENKNENLERAKCVDCGEEQPDIVANFDESVICHKCWVKALKRGRR